MAEVYPSDAILNAVTTDAITGVEYIDTGTAPYYLHFRKLLSRLILATQRANDLRVFDEGTLDIGVKAGKFWSGTTLRTYSGSSGNALADSKSHIYIYINAAGSLVINEYSAWPSASIAHMRLADVTTSGGDITSIVDGRDHHMFFTPGGVIDEPEFYSDDSGTSVEMVSCHWDSASPADDDEMRFAFYGEDNGDNKTEYARATVKLTDVSNATEDAEYLVSVIIAGTLTERFRLDAEGSNSVGFAASDATEIRHSFRADDDGANDTEYVRLTADVTDDTDASEAAVLKLSEMVAGALTSAGDVVGTTKTQTLTNKTLTSPTINTGTITNPTIEGSSALSEIVTYDDEVVCYEGDVVIDWSI